MGVAALSHITRQAIDTGERLVKSLSLDQVTSGWSKYAQTVSYTHLSIFQTVSTTSPAEQFGGTWQEIAFNRVLMGAGTGYTLSLIHIWWWTTLTLTWT